jgi:hypothetical protein
MVILRNIGIRFCSVVPIMLTIIVNREEYKVKKLYETIKTHIRYVCTLFLNLTPFS